jgi:hypothetical protein
MCWNARSPCQWLFAISTERTGRPGRTTQRIVWQAIADGLRLVQFGKRERHDTGSVAHPSNRRNDWRSVERQYDQSSDG